MRILVAAYEGVRIFSDRPYGYKRYYVQWTDGTEEMFSGLWYSEKKVKEIVENKLYG
jgi:hypothetical protein|tara:strand:+ start:1078 stop:1248 length:171 start_codon:yes stop_codon:yes gene_type:complete